MEGHTNWVWNAVFSYDGQYLASASGDCTLCLWKVNTGECLNKFVGHTNSVRAVKFSPNDRLLASASEDCTVRLWDVEGASDFCKGEAPDGR